MLGEVALIALTLLGGPALTLWGVRNSMVILAAAGVMLTAFGLSIGLLEYQCAFKGACI